MCFEHALHASVRRARQFEDSGLALQLGRVSTSQELLRMYRTGNV